MTVDNSLFRDTIHILSTSTTNEYTEPSVSVVASGVPARASFSNNLVINSQGKEVVSDASFAIKPPRGYDVDAGDYVNFDGDYYEVIVAKKPRDDHGIHHLVLVSRRTRELS